MKQKTQCPAKEKEIKAWFRSEEGQRTVVKAISSAKDRTEKYSRDSKVDSKTLYEPFTL